MVGGEAVVPVMSVTPHVVFNYGCLGWVMQRPVPPFLSRVARTVQLETPGGLHNDIATIGKRRIRIRAPLDNSCNDPDGAHTPRRRRRPGGHAVSPLRATRTPPMPLDPEAARGVPPVPDRNGDTGGGRRIQEHSVTSATIAVARGEVGRGLEIFMQCMSRRRLRSFSRRGGPSASHEGVPACNKFLRVLGDAGCIDEAVQAYKAMRKAGIVPTIVTFSTMISRAGACRRVQVAKRFFQEMLQMGIKPDVQAMNSLINAFAKAGKPDEALKVFESMTRYRVTPSIITFNSLIDACARAGDIDRARSIFCELEAAGLEPNDRTFSALIHSHAVLGQVEEAFSLLQDMRASGHIPNRVIYSTLINACGRAGDLSRAFQTLDEMCAAGIEPNVVTWTTLIDACGKGKELEWSFRLFKEMREQGTVPNGVTCSALMDACLKADDIDLAFAVFEHMLDMGIEPTEVTYTSLLTQSARLGQADRAGIVLDMLSKRRGSMRSQAPRPSQRTAPTAKDSSRTSATAVSSPLRSPTVEALRAEVPRIDEMDVVSTTQGARLGWRSEGGNEGQEPSWKIGRELENELLRLFGQADQVDHALKILEGMVERRESPDSDTWFVLLNAVGTAGALDKAFALLERARAENQASEINELTYSALLAACGRAKKLARAFRVMQKMRETGVKPTEETYVALLEACRSTTDSKAAVEVFESMARDGVRPGVRSYTSLLQVISEDNTRRTRILRHYRQIEGLLPASSTTSTGTNRDASNAVAVVAGTDMPPGAFNSVAALGAEAHDDASPTTASATTRAERLHDPGAAGSEGLHESLTSSPRRGLGSPDEAPTSTGGRRVQGDKPGAAQARPSAMRATLDGMTPGPAENPALDSLFRVFLVFQEMRSRGVRPDLRAYNALVNACAEVGELDRALEVVSQMADEDQGGGLQPDAVTYTSLIKAAARATPPKVEVAEEIFLAMQQRTNHFSTFARPTEVTYAHLMKASVGVGKYERALELWEQLLSTGLTPGSRSSRAALSACWLAGDVEAALKVYKVMRQFGIRPDNPSTLVLVKLCRAHGIPEVATQVMRERSRFPKHSPMARAIAAGNNSTGAGGGASSRRSVTPRS